MKPKATPTTFKRSRARGGDVRKGILDLSQRRQLGGIEFGRTFLDRTARKDEKLYDRG